MIHVNIEGKTWPEVTRQLADLIGGSVQPAPSSDSEELKQKLAKTEEELKLAKRRCAIQAEEIAELSARSTVLSEEAENKIAGYEQLLRVKEARIAELEALLDACAGGAEDGETEIPTQVAESAAETPKTASPAPTTGTANESGAEPPTYDKATVREFLGRARDKHGVNIAEVLKPFGGRFPAVDPADYPALMEAVQKAIDEKEKK